LLHDDDDDDDDENKKYSRIIMSDEKSEVRSVTGFKVPSHDVTAGSEKYDTTPEA